MAFRNGSGGSAAGLSAEDIARLDTWMLEIAEAMHSGGREASNGEWRFGHSEKLAVHRGGYWHDFSAGKGDHGALTLLAHLNGGTAANWLAQHSGDGRLGRSDGDEDAEAAQSLIDAEAEAYIDALWFRAEPVTNSPAAMKYFTDRGLDVVAAGADSQLRWMPDWRGDEGVILASISGGAGEIVGVQITHVTPDGKKSDIQPVRKIIKGPHDWRRRGAFRLGAAGSSHLIETEGVEDAVAAMMAGANRVHAVLGASSLGLAELPLSVTEVTLARDDDPSGSPASLQLGRGAARVMLQKATVKVTSRAGVLHTGAKDLNDLLKADASLASRALNDADFIKTALDAAEKEAFLDEVSRASDDAYENNRAGIATALGWRMSVLDADRTKRRGTRAKQAEENDAGGTDIIDFDQWEDPVMDIGLVLNEAVTELRRFLIVPDPSYYDVIALWCLHTHILHRQDLRVSTTARLAFQSPKPRCGKSTGLKAVYRMSHKARMASSISPPSLFRAVDDEKVSLMIDEADNLFKHANEDIVAILNSGVDRMTAYVMRTVPVGDGDFKVRYFKTFTAICFTSIGDLPLASLQDRVIALRLKRATKSERPEKLDLDTQDGLIDIGRKFARWAADLAILPKVNRSLDLYNRIEDKWVSLFRLAAAAGGDWPERCQKAALAAAAQEADDGDRNSDLLNDVWQVFYEEAKVREGTIALHTKAIVQALNNMDEAPWATANNGKPIDGNYLHRHLRGFLPENAKDIAPRHFRDKNGIDGNGYSEKHFEDAFNRYLVDKPLPSAKRREDEATALGGDSSPKEGSQTPKHPSHHRTDGENADNSTTSPAIGEKSQPIEPIAPIAPEPARVAFMVTRAMKMDLIARGYTAEQVSEMTPEQAHEALGGMPAPDACDGLRWPAMGGENQLIAENTDNNQQVSEGCDGAMGKNGDESPSPENISGDDPLNGILPDEKAPRGRGRRKKGQTP